MTSIQALEELYNGLIGHCKSSYLKDQPNNELGKVIMVYEGMFNAIEKELKVLQILKEKRVDLEQIRQYILWREKLEKISKYKLCLTYNRGKKKNRQLTEEEMQQIVEWLKEE